MAVAVLAKIEREIERLLEYRVDEPYLRRWMGGIELPVQVLATLIPSDILFVLPNFAVFFDDPHYQTTPRHSSLLDYPERTLSIAYQAYLTANPDPVKRVQEVHDAMQQATLGKAESVAIAELKKRIADLERANAELTATTPKTSAPVAPPAQGQTQELMMQLEKRVAELERALKESESRRK